MEYLLVLNGVLIGAMSVASAVLYRMDKDLKAKTSAVNAELSEVLRVVNESHNSLIKSMQVLDQKVVETRMKVDNMGSVRPHTTGKFPT